MSQVKVTGRFTHRSVNASGSCSGDRGNVLSVGTYCYVAVCRRGRLSGASALTEGGERREHIVVAHAQLVMCYLCVLSLGYTAR